MRKARLAVWNTCLQVAMFIIVLGGFKSSLKASDYLYNPNFENECVYQGAPERPISIVRYPKMSCDKNGGCPWGEWLSEDPVLMRPFLADPRKITYSVGWRFNDQVFEKSMIDISYGDSIAFYRWHNMWPWNGQLQIELEGALWAIFDPLHESSPLVNADYYVGVPITYAIDYWSFRLRGFHISSHIGDEFLLNHPGFDRRNPSAEYLDFFISHEFTDEIRLYGGIGYMVMQDDSYECSPFYAEYGAEIRLPQWRFESTLQHLYGEPFYAMDFRYNADFKNHVDQTYVLGYEIGKTVGLRRVLRFYIEYHDGYSTEGQFSWFPTNYFSVRTSYGF